jgi:uncharacterized membrane protein
MATKKPTQPRHPAHIKPKINPFSVGAQGLSLLFGRAFSVAVLLVSVSLLGIVIGSFNPTASNQAAGNKNSEEIAKSIISAPPSTIALWIAAAFIIALFVLVVSAMLHGIQSYSAVQLSQGKEVSLRQAFNAVIERFGQYLFLFIWMNIKVFLWSLLFFIPGIIAYYRYSFAGLVFFDPKKKLTGEAAIKESRQMTEDGLITLFASQFLFNLLTLFYADRIVALASLSVLYKRYDEPADKPSPHVLSWVILLFCIALFSIGIISLFV